MFRGQEQEKLTQLFESHSSWDVVGKKHVTYLSTAACSDQAPCKAVHPYPLPLLLCRFSVSTLPLFANVCIDVYFGKTRNETAQEWSSEKEVVC